MTSPRGRRTNQAPLHRDEKTGPKVYARSYDLSTAIYKDLEQECVHAVQGTKFGQINYTDSAGIEEIRQNTAVYIGKRIGVSIDPRTVFLTNGADHAISVALMGASKNKRGDVYLPAPYYFKYPYQVELFHRGSLRGQSSHSAPLAVDQMIKAIREDGVSTVIYNNPNNPLGSIYPQAVLSGLSEESKRSGTQIIYDIVYGDTLYNSADAKDIRLDDPEPLQDRLWIVGSLSKSHGVPGWRLGFVVCPQKSVGHTEHITEITSSNISTVSQLLLNDVLSSPSFEARREALAYEMAHSFRQIAKHVEANHQWLAPHLLKPRAGIFCCLDVRQFCDDDLKLKTDLERAGFNIKVGTAMGYPGLIRLPLTTKKEDYTALFQSLEEIVHAGSRSDLRSGKILNETDHRLSPQPG